MFRPAYIQPLDGIAPKQKVYRLFYVVLAPLYPLWKRFFPKYVTTTRQVGRAMLKVAREKTPPKVVENWDINRY